MKTWPRWLRWSLYGVWAATAVELCAAGVVIIMYWCEEGS